MDERGPNLGLFLLFVVMLQFGYPMTLQGQGWTLLYTLLYVGMIGFGLLVVRDQRDRVLPVLVVGVALTFFALWVAVDPLRGVALLGLFSTLFAFQSGVVYSLLKFVYRRSPARSLNVIVAAISAYLLIGGVFATWFSAVELLVPGSFTDSANPDEPMAWQSFVYFSYVTLATLGYGDIVAVAPWTRSLAALEAVTGTLFLTTVIARLVGMYVGAHTREHRDGGTAD
ncbi:potassium channel family protein [Nocardiopsis sp. EMB25]|uniref:potassium channel family protein n=1 Tax=Nocardiopsis TaxID=2013 RepID=UPI000347E492|nr:MULTISPECIES: potassium channel family protein [Nocardiopsis]MCY9784476.1 potassium channel family protein [Nocardiopsis sp. EMB25]